ncbi:phage-like protein [Escherichia coli]|uniref:Phage-like protein n=4 Tax=Escherichia coli TaxID=562 RepID=A0A376WRT1_ECOLX|nr:phage-like protein [Escherichia coli]
MSIELDAAKQRIAELEGNRTALAVENELARKAFQAFCDVVGDNTEVIAEVVGRDGVLVILKAMKATGNMSATDAFLAEVRAQGVDAAIEAAKNLVAQEYEYKDFKAAQSDCCMHPGSDLVGKVEMTEWLVDFAAPASQRRQPVTVCLIDKRRRGQQIPSVEMPNHTWFCVLDIDGMDTLVDTRHYCDTATATPAKAKKMAALIENWTPPDGWCNGNDRDWHEKMKGYICDFLRKCNGFRVM